MIVSPLIPSTPVLYRALDIVAPYLRFFTKLKRLIHKAKAFIRGVRGSETCGNKD